MLEGSTNYVSDVLFSFLPVTKYLSCYTRRFHQLALCGYFTYETFGAIELKMRCSKRTISSLFSGVICRWTCSFSAGATTTITSTSCPHRTPFLSPAKAEGPHSVVEQGPLPVMSAVALHVFALRCGTVTPVPSRLI